MDRVSPHRLWIGHAGDGRDILRWRDVGVEVVVQIALEELPLVLPRDVISLRFPLIDGTGNRPDVLDLAVSSVAHWIGHRVPTLVCCGAGLSRSPAIAGAALSLAGYGPPDTCLAVVLRDRRGDVSPGLWSEVRALVPR